MLLYYLLQFFDYSERLVSKQADFGELLHSMQSQLEADQHFDCAHKKLHANLHLSSVEQTKSTAADLTNGTEQVSAPQEFKVEDVMGELENLKF